MMIGQWQILIASPDLETRRQTARILVKQGYDPIYAATVNQCREILEKQDIALVFCKRQFIDGDYRDILAAPVYGSQSRRPRAVLMSDLMKPEQYQEARRSGVFDILGLPCRPTNIEWTIILAKRDDRNPTKQLPNIHLKKNQHVKPLGAGAS
jgi:DNA-binding NtrC family response regulator